MNHFEDGIDCVADYEIHLDWQHGAMPDFYQIAEYTDTVDHSCSVWP